MEMKKFEILNLIYNTCVLTSKEKLVAQYFVYKSNRKGECYPSVSTIAAHCGVSERTVQRATKKLREENYITINKRYYKGRQSSNEYQLNIEMISKVTESKCANQSSVSADDIFVGTVMEYISFEELLGCEMKDEHGELGISEVVVETVVAVEIEEVEGESLPIYDYDELDQDIIQFSNPIIEEKEELPGDEIYASEKDNVNKGQETVYIRTRLFIERVMLMCYYTWYVGIIKAFSCYMKINKVYSIVCFSSRDRYYLCYYIRTIPLIYVEGFFMPFLGVT